MILVDDDSGDGIEQAVASCPQRDRIRLLVRRNERGLASAVLHGLAQARGRYLVVMDADLSHPPERIAELLAPIRAGRAEMVIASRYMPGGGTDRRWGLFRRLNSRAATLLARPFASVTDPMSGFFALDRRALARADGLNPIGYKIGLELLVKCRCRPVVEVPFEFADRRRGQSKLTFAEQLRYVEHLSRLYDFKFPRLSPSIKFLIVTFLGVLGGYLWLGLGAAIAGLWGGTILAANGRAWMGLVVATGYFPAIAVNLLAYGRYIKQMKGLAPIRRPRFDFVVISGFEWVTFLAATFAGDILSGQAVWRYWPLFWWLPFLAAFVTRFLLRKLAGHDIRGLPPRAAKD